ncbi:MAG: hypothetical protein ACOYXM_08725 [Actinomycetota bacterium]
MDLNKLTTSDKIIAGSGIVLFIAYFLPWFEADAGIVSVTASGGDVGFFWATLPMLIGLVLAAAVIANKLFDVKLPDLPVPWGQAFLGAGALAALLVVLKLIIGEDADGAEAFGIDISRSFGIFLAALAAIGLAVGGYLKMQEGDSGSSAGDGPGSAPF